MNAAEILAQAQAAGIRLEPMPDGHLKVAPRSRLTDELLALILAHRAAVREVLIDLDTITRWLDSIEERDPAIREHVLRECLVDPSKRAYFLRHATGEHLH